MAKKTNKPSGSPSPLKSEPQAVTNVTDISSGSVPAQSLGLGKGLWGIVGNKTRYSSVIQFSGLEYVRYEYRRIPEEFRAAAAVSTFLDVVEVMDGADSVVAENIDAPMALEDVQPEPVVDPEENASSESEAEG